jgi:hypothetical protein
MMSFSVAITVLVKADGNHPIKLGHRLGNVHQHVGLNDGVADRVGLHVQLLRERLHNLLIGHQAHFERDLAQLFAGLLLLLLQQQFELVITDVTQVDQDLSDAPNGHVKYASIKHGGTEKDFSSFFSL